MTCCTKISFAPKYSFDVVKNLDGKKVSWLDIIILGTP